MKCIREWKSSFLLRRSGNILLSRIFPHNFWIKATFSGFFRFHQKLLNIFDSLVPVLGIPCFASFIALQIMFGHSHSQSSSRREGRPTKARKIRKHCRNRPGTAKLAELAWCVLNRIQKVSNKQANKKEKIEIFGLQSREKFRRFMIETFLVTQRVWWPETVKCRSTFVRIWIPFFVCRVEYS